MNNHSSTEQLHARIKELENELESCNKKNDFEDLFMSNKAVMLVLDPENHNILYANRSAAEFYGYSIEKLTSMNIKEINTMTEDEIKSRVTFANKNNHNTFFFKHRLSSGEVKEVEIYQSKFKTSQNKDAFSLIINDVSKNHENSLTHLGLSNIPSEIQKDAGVGYFIFNPQSGLISLSTNLIGFLGFKSTSASFPITEFVDTYINSSDKKILLNKINDIKKNLDNKDYQSSLSFRFQKPNRRTLYVKSYLRMMKTGDISGIVIDNTESKLYEMAIKESEERYREYFDNNISGIYRSTAEGIFIDCNPAFENITGYKFHELKDLNPDKIYSNKGELNIIVNKVKQNKTIRNYEVDLIKKTGEKIHCIQNVIGIQDETGRLIQLRGYIFDITDRVIALNALKESETRFRELFVKSGDSIIILENNKIADCNNATVALFGYNSISDLIGKFPWDISPEVQPDGLSSKEKANQYIKNAIDNGNFRFEWMHKKKNGNNFLVEVLLTTILNSSAKPLVHAVCRDITIIKKNENDLIQAKNKAEESDKLKSAFLANMSHEIRTPMNGIMGFASLLNLPDLNKEQTKQYISVIEKSGKRMLSIINDLMDISKIQSGQMELVKTFTSINEQLKYLQTLFSNEASKDGLILTYKCGLSDKESVTYTDGEKLYAILANLIKNAIKYSDIGEIEFGYLKKEKKLEFYVRDRGIGIPKERQKAIFERFVQADIDDKKVKEGAGLGLAISKAYTELLDGEIWVESQLGLGSTFYFTIPYIPKSAIKLTLSQTHDQKAKNTDQSKLNILICEDEDFSYSFLEIALKDKSRKITRAKNGKEAVEKAREDEDLDLILMDIRMPVMNGYAATQQIRKFNNNVIIIAQTAHALHGDMYKALKAGCNDYITKPITTEALFDKIESYF